MRVILIILLAGICFSSYAQKDRVYFKNGSIIKGQIADAVLTDSVTVFVGETQLRLPLSQVSELVFSKREYGKKPEGYKNYSYAKGYFFNLTAGLVFGDHFQSNSTQARPKFEVAYEYHHSPWLNLAVGGGLDPYVRYTFVPVYLQYQYVFGEKDRALFLYARGGKGFMVKNELDEDLHEITPGFYGGIGAGWQKKVGTNFIRLQLGYQAQKVEEKEVLFVLRSWPWSDPAQNFIIRDRTLNRMAFSFSFIF